MVEKILAFVPKRKPPEGGGATILELKEKLKRWISWKRGLVGSGHPKAKDGRGAGGENGVLSPDLRRAAKGISEFDRWLEVELLAVLGV